MNDKPHLVRDALAAGVTPGQLRSARWRRPFWGVRSAHDVSPEKGFAPRLSPGAFFFGTSAARLHALPLPAGVPALPVHVAVPAGSRRPDARDVRAHHVAIDPMDLTRIDGIPITTVERTWCDLAAVGLPLGPLVAAGDAILWWRRPRSSVEALVAAVRRYRGRRGTRTLAAALPMLDGRADSPPESEIRVALMCAGVRTPEVNHAIRLDEALLHVDLAWPSSRVALEYEGDHHRTDRDQWHYDIRRYDLLSRHGWLVVRATAADYRNPERLIERVSESLR